MNSKIITFIISMLTGVILIIGGGYIVIDNLLNPHGLLFEGLVIGTLGTLLILMTSIAMSIGQTILIFSQIMEQQTKIQKEMRNMANSRPSSIGSILSKLLPGITDENTTLSITDITTGEKNFPDLEHMKRGRVSKLNLADMSLEELEQELSKAIVKDDFERASEVNLAIKKNKDNSGPDEKSE